MVPSASAAGDRPITMTWGEGSTGSTYTSSAPSLWHAIGTVTTPSRWCSASSSAVPKKSSRAVPSSSVRRASRITVGSAQAPPIQPVTFRSAVISAVAPGFPDEGALAHTTVARANGSPASARRSARARISGFTPELSLLRSLPRPSPTSAACRCSGRRAATGRRSRRSRRRPASPRWPTRRPPSRRSDGAVRA